MCQSDYIDPELIQEFEEKFHTRVKEVYYETEEAVDELLLEGNGKGYDLLVVSRPSTAHYIRRNWVAPFFRRRRSLFLTPKGHRDVSTFYTLKNLIRSKKRTDLISSTAIAQRTRDS
jgi:hypothetical protein